MSADKTNKYILWCELNHNDQSEVVALYIEDIMLITNIIYRVKGFLNVGKAMPFCFFGFFKPVIKGCLGLRMYGVILYQFLFGNDSHAVFYLTQQIYNNYSKYQNNLTIFVRLFWLINKSDKPRKLFRNPEHSFPADATILLVQREPNEYRLSNDVVFRDKAPIA